MTTTYSPGDRVRVARSTVPDTVDGVGMTGTVSRVEHQDEPDIFGETVVWVALDERLRHWDDGKAWPFHVDELELLPTLHDSLAEAERTGGMVQITGPSYTDALRRTVTTLDAQRVAMDRMAEAIDSGLAEGRRMEDLDLAAQAIVDAADVWAEDGEPRPLLDAVLHWRQVRDGGAR